MPLEQVALHHIVLPIDFSAPADLALPRTLAIAERFGAEVDLLHVLVADSRDADTFFRISYARARLEAIRLSYRAQLSGRVGARIHTHVVCAPTAVEGVLDHVRRQRGDLLVMTTHGWNGHNSVRAGSVTRAALAAAPCPVLTVPIHHPTPGTIGRVHVAFGDAPGHARALRFAAAMANRFGSTLRIYVPTAAVVPVHSMRVDEKDGGWEVPAPLERAIAHLLPPETPRTFRTALPGQGGIRAGDVRKNDLLVLPHLLDAMHLPTIPHAVLSTGRQPLKLPAA